MSALRDRAQFSPGRYASDSEGLSDAPLQAYSKTFQPRPTRPYGLDRFHSDVNRQSDYHHSDHEPSQAVLQNRRRSQSVILTSGHPNVRESRYMAHNSLVDVRASQVLPVEPASPVPAVRNPVHYRPEMHATQPRQGRTLSLSPPPPPMTPDDTSASDASEHLAQRTRRRVLSTAAPFMVSSHHMPSVDFASMSPTTRRKSFFVSTPATRGGSSPSVSDGFSSAADDWVAPSKDVEASPTPLRLPPRRTFTFQHDDTAPLANPHSIQMHSRPYMPPYDAHVDFGPPADSPEGMNSTELENSVVQKHRLTMAGKDQPQPPAASRSSGNGSGRPSLNAKRISGTSAAPSRSSVSSNHSKRTPSLTLRIPGKPEVRSVMAAPSPVRTFLVPRPQLVATPIQESSPVYRFNPRESHNPSSPADSDGEAVVHVAQVALWSPAPKLVPPPFPRPSTTNPSEAARGPPERRYSTMIPTAVDPSSDRETSEATLNRYGIRNGIGRSGASHALREVTPSASSKAQQSSAYTRPEPRRRSPSPPIRRPAPQTTRSPSPPKGVTPPPRSMHRPSPEPSYARPTAASSSARVPVRSETPPRNRYDAVIHATSSRILQISGRSSPAPLPRVQEKSSMRTLRTRTPSPPPRLIPPPRQTPSPPVRGFTPAVRSSSPPVPRPTPPPISAIPAALREALKPSHSTSSSTMSASNRNLPPLPRAPPSTPAVPHFTEAVTAALEKASPPKSTVLSEATSSFVATTVPVTQTQLASVAPLSSAGKAPRVRDFLVNPAAVTVDQDLFFASPQATNVELTDTYHDTTTSTRRKPTIKETAMTSEEDTSSSSRIHHAPLKGTTPIFDKMHQQSPFPMTSLVASGPAQSYSVFTSGPFPLPKPVPVRGMSDRTILSVTSTIVDGSDAEPGVLPKDFMRVTNPDEERPVALRRQSPARGQPASEVTTQPVPPPSTIVHLSARQRQKQKEPEPEHYQLRDGPVLTSGQGADVHRSDTATASTLHADTSWEQLSAKASATKSAIKTVPLSAPLIHAFEADYPPSPAQLADAAEHVVVTETGVRVRFGELFADRRTIVLFIRHFWCPWDQDFMYSVSRHVNMQALERANVGLVVIGCGAPAMIKSYRREFLLSLSSDDQGPDH
jgi:hypothetical protein